MDTVLRGVGYPEPVTPVGLFRTNDGFAEARRRADEMKLSRSNVRHGWMRSDG
jgi:L,D-peptidoglycan transpeptidase YkuD (ErfK/YbiS/YcfS/YnhG family)